jgi:thiamine biosynthesis lipoprotein
MTGREHVNQLHPSRRDILRMGLGAFLVSAVPFSWQRRTVIRRSIPVMGTIAEFAVLSDDSRHAHDAISAAAAELRMVERTMSRFDPRSDVGRANRLAADEGVVITEETRVVIEQALEWAEASDGAFDPCMGRALEIWDVEHRRVPPAERRTRPLAGRRLYRGVDLSSWRGSPAIRLADRDTQIDLGGIGKGYAVDRAVMALRTRGIDRALVNVGGDLYALGMSPSGDPWKIGIRSPKDPSRLAGTLELTDGAVATSGDYFQFFQHGGRRYHHILDPETAMPRRSTTHSVSVTAGTTMAADAAATAVFGMPRRDAERVIASRGMGVRIVSAL